MRNLLLLALICCCSLITKAQFAPPTIWLDATNLHELDTVGILEKRTITTDFINFQPSLIFNKDISTVAIPYNVDQSSRFTIFTVYQPSDTIGEQVVWSSSNSERNMMLTTRRVSTPKQMMEYSEGNKIIPVLHTVVQHWGVANNTTDKVDIQLGTLQEPFEKVSPLEGSIAEFIVFDRMLKRAERMQMETYLALKYGISLKADYVSSNEQIIWNYQENALYNNRIAGIGRNDVLQLYQKQSQSSGVDATLSIGIEKIALANAANSGVLEDNNYMIWGDNGEALTFEENNSLHWTKRNWLVHATTEDQLPSTEVRFDLSHLELPKNTKLALLINRAGASDFNSDQVDQYIVDHIGNDHIVSFKNVLWDTDGSGSDLFTLQLIPFDYALETFILSPNPSSGAFNLDAQYKEATEIVVRIYDVEGKLVMELKDQGKTNFQFTEQLLQKGEYFVELTANGSSITKSLIVTQ